MPSKRFNMSKITFPGVLYDKNIYLHCTSHLIGLPPSIPYFVTSYLTHIFNLTALNVVY